MKIEIDQWLQDAIVVALEDYVRKIVIKNKDFTPSAYNDLQIFSNVNDYGIDIRWEIINQSSFSNSDQGSCHYTHLEALLLLLRNTNVEEYRP